MKRSLQIQEKQYFDEYILIAPGSDYGRTMWSDIEKIPNGMILDNALRPCSKLLETIHHIHFSFAINRRIQLPFQKIWKKFYSIENIKFDINKKYCVIYTDISAARTDCSYLKNLQSQKNIILVLIMVNTMKRRGSLIEKRRTYFEQVYSFDRKDCEEYGFIYHPTSYSMVNLDIEDISEDAFYVGVSKGRAKIIGDVFKKIVSNDAKAQFFISGMKFWEIRTKGIHYNQWLNYRRVLEYIGKSNCIVEIMDGNQEGVTLRTMEAICYNKKLLTNNQLMKTSKYYLSGNIQVFDNPDDIDVNFVKDRNKINYKYEGEFSPICLLESITRRVSEKDE